MYWNLGSHVGYIVEDVLEDIWSWRLKYPECALIIGDFNSDLDKQNNVSSIIKGFLYTHQLIRCDLQFPNRQRHTYVNEALGHSSQIDYFVCD